MKMNKDLPAPAANMARQKPAAPADQRKTVGKNWNSSNDDGWENHTIEDLAFQRRGL